MSMPGEGGQTKDSPSGWTVDTLRAEIVGLLGEVDRRYEQRFVAQEKAVDAALQAAKEAVIKAEMAAEKRFDSVNEFRATLSDQAARLMPRAEVVVMIQALDGRVDKLEHSTEASRGHSKGLSDSWGYLVGAVGFAATIIAIIVAFHK